MYSFEIATVRELIETSIMIKQRLLADHDTLQLICDLGEMCCESLQSGGKILFAGNGGSFADSQHLTAEFISRLQFDRAPLAAIALGTNSSSTTAIGNDYGFEQIFNREIAAIGHARDVFIPITTSGNSPNILLAAQKAKEIGMKIVGFTGQSGGNLSEIVRCIRVPSGRTERIQECHIMIGHILCGLVENRLFKST